MQGTARNNHGPEPIDLLWDRTSPEGLPGGDAGVPLLLINGLGSPLVAYQQGFVDLLVAEGFDVVRFDNRDIGKSSATTEKYTVADMALDAVVVMDAVGWESANVVGQSMGGMIAQQLTIDHPARVRSLISVMSSTGERGFGQPTKEALTALLTVPPVDPEGWKAHRLESEKVWASPPHWNPEWVLAKAQEMLEHGVDPKGTARQYRAIQASGSRDEALAKLDTPTLVIHGSDDTLIQPTGGKHTADVIPDARYVEIEGMGHDLAPPLWPRLVKEVTEFVKPTAA